MTKPDMNDGEDLTMDMNNWEINTEEGDW